ncbi:hypothetical protein D3C77_724690 [compost metagenome]
MTKTRVLLPIKTSMVVAGVIINDRNVLRSFSSAIKQACAKHVSNTNERLRTLAKVPATEANGKEESTPRIRSARIIGSINIMDTA